MWPSTVLRSTVMEIAKLSDLKPETIDMEDAKLMTLSIFECIHQNLRVVYVGQRDLLRNGYKLWRTLELRFHTVNQVQRDIERLLGLKQGNRSLYKFVVDYDNLRRKLAGSKLSELYSEEAMIEQLFRASPSSQRSFPHGLTDLDKVINTLLEIAKLKGDMDGQDELPTA